MQEGLPVDQQDQSSVPLHPVEAQTNAISEQDRKRAKMTAHMQQIQQFIATTSRGLLKIIEDISSQIMKR